LACSSTHFAKILQAVKPFFPPFLPAGRLLKFWINKKPTIVSGSRQKRTQKRLLAYSATALLYLGPLLTVFR